LDVLSKQAVNPSVKFNCFAEVSNLKYPENPKKDEDWLSGRADYSRLFPWLIY
jgi:hypothetical protein